MKNLLLVLLSFCIVLLKGNTQTVTSAALTLEYKNYTAGQYHFTVTNNQPCTVNVSVNWNSRSSDSIIVIAAGATTEVFITAAYDAGSSIKIKTSDRCTPGANAGYISVPVATILALRDPVIYGRPRPADPLLKAAVYNMHGVFLKELYTTDISLYLKALPPAPYIIRTRYGSQTIFQL